MKTKHEGIGISLHSSNTNNQCPICILPYQNNLEQYEYHLAWIKCIIGYRAARELNDALNPSIEYRVALNVKRKLQCLSNSVASKERWENLL